MERGGGEEGGEGGTRRQDGGWIELELELEDPPPPSGSQRLTLRAGISSGIRLGGLLQSLEGEGDAGI